MQYFFYILLNNVIPLILVIAAGAFLYRAFKIDGKTLSKMIFYLLGPVIIFDLIYESELSWGALFKIVLFFVIYLLVLLAVVQVACWMKGYRGGIKHAMRNSVLLYNSGNYGLPLNHLVFSGNPAAVSIQALMMVLQNLLGNTFGVYAVNADKNNLRQTMGKIFSLPSIYVIPLAFMMREWHVPIVDPIAIPMRSISDAYIPIALLTLGVQLGAMSWKIRFSDVAISVFLRLCIGPLAGFLLVLLMGFEGIIAQALVLSCAVPTSVLSLLLAVEFDSEAEFSSQVVLASTVFSIFTVTVVIYLLQYVN